MEIHAILSSSSFSNKNIKDFFDNLVKDFQYKKSVIVTTAHPKKEKSEWNIITADQLKDSGLDCQFVDFEKGENVPDDTDVVYVCGGNTFRLLKYAKEAGFKKQIERLFNRDGLYFGSSAGSIILSPNISSAAEVSPDKNTINLKDFTGFNFIDFHIIPHYSDEEREAVDVFEKNHTKRVERLRNGEAFYIKDSSIEKIS